jgi:hypothetical protein
MEEKDISHTYYHLKSANNIIVAISVIVPLLSSTLFLSSPASMWGLINQYQLFLMLPFLNCYLPKKFIDFIQDLQVTLIDASQIDSYSIFRVDEWVESLHYEHPYSEYQKNYVHSGSFAVEQYNLFKIFILLIGLNMLFLFLYL